MSEDLQLQYERYPYPLRKPDKEVPGGTVTLLNKLPLIAHYLFNGCWERFEDFRVLVAGGGTGDATVHLAEQLAAIRSNGEVVHLDIAATSMDIARQRIQKLGLRNVKFVHGSILDLADMGLEDFDYIDCTGVLHHLEDPVAGAEALNSVLKSDGGMSVMVYGELGRTGIYHVQEMMRMLSSPATTLHERIPIARDLLSKLPKSNWLSRSGWISIPQSIDDNEIVDLLLHVRDRAYRISEIYELVMSAGLRVVSFMPPFFYDPMKWVPEGSGIRTRLGALSYCERVKFAELFAGGPDRHCFFAVRKERPNTVFDHTNVDDFIPVLLYPELKPREPRRAATLNIAGNTIQVSELENSLLFYIDNNRTISEIFTCLGIERQNEKDTELNRRAWERVFRILHPFNALVLKAGHKLP